MISSDKIFSVTDRFFFFVFFFFEVNLEILHFEKQNSFMYKVVAKTQDCVSILYQSGYNL
jgi:hypothetical protein